MLEQIETRMKELVKVMGQDAMTEEMWTEWDTLVELKNFVEGSN